MNLAAMTENQKNSDLKKLTEKFLFAALSCQEFTLLLSLLLHPVPQQDDKSKPSKTWKMQEQPL